MSKIKLINKFNKKLLSIGFLLLGLIYFMHISSALAYMGHSICDPSAPLSDHRVNCADIIDLPLCEVFAPIDQIKATGYPDEPLNANCVANCSDFSNPDINANPPNIRSKDYAVHNKNCIRFCDNVEAGVIPKPGDNCTSRKCHQLSSSQTPNSTPANIAGQTLCNTLACNLLTKEELNDTKFDNKDKKYCNGDINKCYSFPLDKLPYVRFRDKNSMCQIHNCPPTVPSCGADDTLDITNKGTAYVADYKKYFNGNQELNSGLCKRMICKSVINRRYLCTSDAAGNITKDSNCDASSTCDANKQCAKKIDCNIAANNGQPECETPPTKLDMTNVLDNVKDNSKSWFYRPIPPSHYLAVGDNINKDLICYSDENIYNNNWTYGLSGAWYVPGDMVSPGHCNATDWGGRDLGLHGLCGVDVAYSSPTSNTAYIQGYASANYELSNPEYKIMACLRFKNSGRLSACGIRECGIDCAFSTCDFQMCGFDKCNQLTVREKNPDECSPETLFYGPVGDDYPGCAKTIGGGASLDSYVRVRAKKYKHRQICTFLDLKGVTGWSGFYYDGNETLDDGSCTDGKKDSGGTCKGFDTNGKPGLAHVWRTALTFTYIGNNRETTGINAKSPGFVTYDNQFFAQQQCAKVPLRIGPPRFYNIATPSNSPHLFSPPLYVSNVRTIRGGPISTQILPEQFGVTDFHFPELEARFNTATQLLSLGAGYIGSEDTANKEANPSSPPSAIMTTVSNQGVTFKAEVLVKKEYNENDGQPSFCLYRRFYDENYVPIDKKISCVARQKPSLSKAVISEAPGNLYNKAAINLRLLLGQNRNCSNSQSCSKQISLFNLDNTKEDCSYDIENYKFCAKRDECSRLYNECVDNEINLYNAQKQNQSTSSFLAIRTNCNTMLLNNCNSKKGIVSGATDIFSQNSSNTFCDTSLDNNCTSSSSIPRAYGWRNEICITKGFESSLGNVYAYKVGNSSVKGKCIIDTESPYLTDGNSNCNDGGSPPGCLCIDAPPHSKLTDEEALTMVIRPKTAREAGLCVDIPLPKICPAIDYTPVSGPLNDPFFVYSSLGKSSYSDGVNTSHQTRTAGNGHAEFNSTFAGMTNFPGECNGFWKKVVNNNGVSLSPTLTCSAAGTWSSTVDNACVRYSCPTVITSGVQRDGTYQGRYGLGETGEDKGKFDGFAIWNEYTKTNDFMEYQSSTQCIPGFKKDGSDLSGTNCDPAYFKTGQNCAFKNGTNPSRSCNQIGQWGEVTTPCKRLSCAAINPPANPQTQSDFDQWGLSSGATFPTVLASRNSTIAMAESISTGTCNRDLGFFQSPGGPAPTRECNSLGQWGPVINPCVTTCKSIDNTSPLFAASTSNNGFATWAEVNNVPINGAVDAEFKGCVTGYVQSPYSPTNSTDIFNDNKTLTTPSKRCLSVVTAGGQANVWEASKNGCINACPSATVDPRIGVGITRENVAYSTVTGTTDVSWPSTSLNQDAYIYYPTNALNAAALNTSFFTQGRTNGAYILARHCGADGKWGDTVPSCSTNDGQVNFARYSLTNRSSSIPVGGSRITGTCINGYVSNPDAPQRECRYDNGNKIDQVYLALTNTDCKQVICKATTSKLFYSTITKARLAYYNGPNQDVLMGNKINLDCAPASYTQDGPRPTATCQSDGNFTQDLESCKINCSTTSTSCYLNPDGPSSKTYTLDPTKVIHGKTLEFAQKYTSSDCVTWDYAASCNDGDIVVHQNCNADHYGYEETCGSSRFNWSTNSWMTRTYETYDDNTVVFQGGYPNIRGN